MNKTREEMLSALTQHIPKEEISVPKNEVTTIGPSDETLIKDSEEDVAFARENVKKLISTTDEAIGTMLNLATESEHPRAFEVLANLIKTASDANKQLIDLAKERKKLVCKNSKNETSVTGNITNNAIFVGSTAELQKNLKEAILSKQTIDVNEIIDK